MTEVWKDVEGTGYQVSSLGRLIGRKGRILHPTRMPNGYYAISIDKTLVYVHRLVAEAFLGRPEGKQVDHIDGNKANNTAENLRWVTARENVTYSYVLGRGSNRTSRKGIPVVMITQHSRTQFPSMSAAARAVKRSQSRIWQALNQGNLCAGARWQYAE
jgi:hypothetical protein